MSNSTDFSMISAYNGKEPYIFISYAHKDSAVVMPIVKGLQDKGFRVWIDLGIEAGTEWSNNIASHLRDCSAFLAFISSNSVNSENCLDEIAYAKSNQKASLMVFLEDDVVLPEGTEMQTARFQRMFYKRHSTLDSFVENISAAPIFESCKGEGVEVKKTISESKIVEKKLPDIFKDKKILAIAAGAIVAIIVLCLVLFLPGGNSEDKGDIKATKAPVTEMSDDLSDYTVELDGKVYKLPIDFSELTKEGWTITSSNITADTMLAGESKGYVSMANNGKKLDVTVYNLSGNSKKVSECPIGGFECYLGSGPSFEVAKGVNAGSSIDEIVAALGEPQERRNNDDYVVLVYSTGEMSAVEFFIYTEEKDKSYNSLSVMNFVKLDTDKTETNTKAPEYLSSYKAPSELGTDVISGKISIEGITYQLPVPMSEVIKNGWEFKNKPSYVVSGGTQTVTMKKGEATLDFTITNLAEYQTIPENCIVTKLFITDYDKASVTLPGNITVNSTDAEVSNAAGSVLKKEENRYSWYSDDGESSLTISMDKETGKVSYISIKHAE